MRWLVLWLCLLPGFANAQQAVNLIADSVIVTVGPVLEARGNVEVFYGDLRLSAAAIRYDQTTDRLDITGPIFIQSADGTILTAEAATLDPRLENGILRSARLVLNRQLQLAANRIDRVDGRYSALTQVAATSCHVCGNRPPLWEIRAGSVIHDEVEQQLYFEDAVLRVAGVPIIWLPRMRLPDPSLDRASGFLVPNIRTTDQLGLGLKLPYFIAMGDQRDLTLTPYLSGATMTLEARYRQAYLNGTFGVSGAVSRDDLMPDRWRGYLFAQGAFDLGHGMQLAFDAELVSDPAYLIDYGYADQDRLDSAITLTRVRADSLFLADLTTYTSLRDADSYATLPPVVAGFSHERRLFPAVGGTLTLRTGAEGFWRTANAVGDDGRDVARVGIGADWQQTWVLPGGVLADARAGLDADLYRIADDPDFASPVFQTQPAAQVTLRWPLIRTKADGSVQVLDPVVALGWGRAFGADVPNEDGVLPEFDEANLFGLTQRPGQDRFDDGFHLAAGVNWIHTSAQGREVRLTFGRLFRDTDPAMTPGTGLAGLRSDWLIAGQMTLGDGLQVTARTLIDDTATFGRTEARLVWAGALVDLSAAYVWLPADRAAGQDDPISEWAIEAAYVLSDQWTIRADARYDMAADQPARAGFGINWQNECVTVDLSVVRRYTTSETVEPTTDYGLSVTLNGFSAGRQAVAAPPSCRG